jgi:hypothetical protein
MSESTRIWDIGDRGSPVHLATVRGGTDPPAFGPDGHTLATVRHAAIGAASTVTLFDYGPLTALRTDPAARTCAVTGRGLTPEEWNRYIPELPYQPGCH